MSNKKIAITGGIGSGKSTVSKILRELDFQVFSCDEIYKDIVKSPAYIQKIKELFPQVVIQNQIDKQKLAKLVFSDEKSRLALNHVAHPLIMETLLKNMELEKNSLVFAEVPLLFEEKLERYFDEIWVVLRDFEARVQSSMERDQCDRKAVLNRINTQFDYEHNDAMRYFRSINAIIIENNRDEDTLKEQVKQLLV